MERSPVLVLRLSVAARWPITCAGCAAAPNRPGALSKRAPGRGFAAAQPAQIPGHRAASLHQRKAASRRSGVVGGECRIKGKNHSVHGAQPGVRASIERRSSVANHLCGLRRNR